MGVDAAWDRIEAWLKSHARDVRKSLKPAATSQAVKKIQATLGVNLPSDFTASVARHNGQDEEAVSGLFPHTDDGFEPEPAWRLLSLVEMRAFWEQMKELVDAGEFVGLVTDPAPGVGADWWSPGWVPFADNGGGDALCLDTTPAEGGRVGQVVLFWHAARERPILAGSFEELLTRLADGLESGRYAFDPVEGLIEPTPESFGEGERAAHQSSDRTMHVVILLPVERPTPEQLKVVRELSRHQHANLLEVRELVRAGGFRGFGEFLGEGLASVIARLEQAGIPHRIEAAPSVRDNL